jgi:MFS family permease
MKRGGRTPAIGRRDWRGYFRVPMVRLARMVALAIVAGVALGLTWKGAAPAFLVAGLALYIAGYDAVEPLSQEIDHPSRWDGIPEDHGKTLLSHLPASFVVMVLLCLIAAASALVFAPSSVVLGLLPVAIVPVATGAMMGAALSTAMGSPDTAKLLAGFGADMMGWVLLFRLVAPPALVLLSLATLLAAGSDPNALDTTRVSNLIGYTFLLSASVILYLRYQKPARL